MRRSEFRGRRHVGDHEAAVGRRRRTARVEAPKLAKSLNQDLVFRVRDEFPPWVAVEELLEVPHRHAPGRPELPVPAVRERPDGVIADALSAGARKQWPTMPGVGFWTSLALCSFSYVDSTRNVGFTGTRL